MYLLRTKDCPKSNLKKRCALPDRVFFACGACHILAHVFLEKYALSDVKIIWIKPNLNHTGNHIFVSFRDIVFDFHGYSDKKTYLSHYWKRAKQLYPDWNASLVEIMPESLIVEGPSKRYEGLYLRAPHQFFCNPIPRAENYLAKIEQTKINVCR